MGTLDGKVALVTGSASGIGEATARRFAAEGATVVVNSRSSVEAGQALAHSLPGGASYLQADVSDEAAAVGLIEATVERHGRLDVLVNNAGTTEVIAHDDLDAATTEVWRRILDTNLLGTWWTSRAAVPHLKAVGAGAIVNVTSVAGLRQIGSSIPYAVSKAAINHLTALMAKVVGPEVRVNAVAPGLVDTPWTESWDAIRTAYSAATPLHRSGQPDDVAEVILAAVTSGWMTGQVLAVDGGAVLVL